MFIEGLDDHFEYSGELNQDYLRSMLGKAVTRRRTNLISYIKKDGKRPLNFDEDIWDRLEKLASSKQREDRTKHGRYANGCRRTMGQTGPLGMEGVRRKLSDLYGRSPDPEEIAHEMERDKGFGKIPATSHAVTKMARKEFMEDDREEEPSEGHPLKNSLKKYVREGNRHEKWKGGQSSSLQVRNMNVYRSLVSHLYCTILEMIESVSEYSIYVYNNFWILFAGEFE